ncbi:TPA: hypothetical protein DCZ39_00270 [Patescibacteria group bacterium]|nr:hypothetical protein [Candidatus Gracilibacteria bacterium]
MKNKQEKFLEFHRDLEKKKKQAIWSLIGMSIVFIFMIFTVHIMQNDFMYILIVGFAWAIFPVINAPLNIEKLEKELTKKIKTEEEYVNQIKEEYDYLISPDRKFRDIPAKLRKTAGYLLSQEDKTPEEVIAMRGEEIEDMQIKLHVYRESIEHNFWQYLISGKWLKFK